MPFRRVSVHICAFNVPHSQNGGAGRNGEATCESQGGSLENAQALESGLCTNLVTFVKGA